MFAPKIVYNIVFNKNILKKINYFARLNFSPLYADYFIKEYIYIMRIIGTGSALPVKTVTNDMLAAFLDTSDSWIKSRTGINTRHLLSTETLSELAISAAISAMESANVKPEDIDYLICSNVANSYVTPGLSTIILGPLGCCCPCTDLNGACTGFIYALDIADAFFKTGRVKKVLIVAAEEPSRFCNWHERETSVLFGDGAGAVVLDDGDGFVDFHLTGDTHTDVLYYKRSMEATPFDRVDERTNLQNYGNTSSASIPILMDELSRAGVLKDGMRLLFSAFGGGFVTGATVLKWSQVNYPTPAVQQ